MTCASRSWPSDVANDHTVLLPIICHEFRSLCLEAALREHGDLLTAWARGTVGLLEKGGGPARRLADLPIVVPSSRVPLIQEAHDAIVHVLCEAIDLGRLGS